MQFSEKLKFLLNENQLTPYKLHRVSGLPKTTIYNYIHGYTLPTYIHLKILCDTFDCSGDFLLDNCPLQEALTSEEVLLLGKFKNLKSGGKSIIFEFINLFNEPLP